MMDGTKQPQAGVAGGNDKGIMNDGGNQTPPKLSLQLPTDAPSSKGTDEAKVIFNNRLPSDKENGDKSDSQQKMITIVKGGEEDKDRNLTIIPRGKQARGETNTLGGQKNNNQPTNQGQLADNKVRGGEKLEEGRIKAEKKAGEEKNQEEKVKVDEMKSEEAKESDLEKQVEELVALVGSQNQAQAQSDAGGVGEEQKEDEKGGMEEKTKEKGAGEIKAVGGVDDKDNKMDEPKTQTIKPVSKLDQATNSVTPNPDDFQKDKFGSITYDFTDEDEADEGGFWGKGMDEQTEANKTQIPKPGTISEAGELQEEKPMMSGQSESETMKEEKTEGLKEGGEGIESQVKMEGDESVMVGGQINQGVGLATQKGVEGKSVGKEEMGAVKEDKVKDLQEQNKEMGVQGNEGEQEGVGLSGKEATDLKEGGEEDKETTSKDGAPPTPPEDLKPAADEPPKKPFHWVRWVSFGLSILIVIGIGFFIWQKIKGGSNKDLKPKLTEIKPEQKVSNVKLVYWGLWEDGRIMQPLLDKFKKETGITVEYVQKSPRNYRLVLESAIKENKGPDVFRFHNTWVPMLKEELDDVPANVYSAEEFARTFYPVAVQDLSWQGKLKGVPLEIDGLMLFYNKDLLAKAGLDKDLPTNWDQLAKQARQLTTYGEGGKINVAGVALGTVNNVDHWSDIVGLMFYQNGVEMERLDTSLDAQGRNLAADVLRYYTHFITGSSPTWSEDLPPSTVMFGSGRLAFYFGPSWRAFEFAKNGVNFGIINVPKIPGDNSEWASYWVEGVSVKSKHKKEAWQFVKFLSQAENLRMFFNEAKKYRLFGEPYARQDMREELAKDPYLSALAAAAPNMKSYYFASFTYDQGLNDRINDVLGFEITQVLSGKEPERAVKEVKRKINQILANYGAKE